MSDIYIKFVREFRRKTFGMDAKQIAEALFISPTSVRSYISYKSTMSSETMLRAAKIFGIDISLLLGVRNDKAE